MVARGSIYAVYARFSVLALLAAAVICMGCGGRAGASPATTAVGGGAAGSRSASTTEPGTGEPLSRGEAEVVIARAAGLVRSLAAVVSAGSRDCDALAASLEQWLAQHRAELADVARDAARIPEDLRAELMRSELGDEVALFEGLGSLDACAALPAAAEAMAALESIAAGSSGDSGNSGGSGS